MNSIKKIKRFSKIVHVLSKHGFDELIARSNFDLFKSSADGENDQELFTPQFNQRIRLAIEELGPTYIKFGQLLSNRKDLVPEALIEELKKLQDDVPPEEMDIYEKIKLEFGIEPQEHFSSIEKEPFAAASISQVYNATLTTGERVILKVKRTHIHQIIESDLALLRDLISFLEKKYPSLKQLFIGRIAESFENAILEELSLTNEYQNIERFRYNFRKSKLVYVPKTYSNYSNNSVLCMEFIQGDKINDLDALKRLGLDPKAVVQQGLEVYLKQVLEDGFFHADPHPGNIFIKENGQIVFIDFGAMGILSTTEKAILEDVVINFGLKNAKKLVRHLKKMSLEHYISNERQLERQIEDVFDYLEYTTVATIEVQVIIKKFNRILNENHILLPEYVYILMRGVALIEGIGQQLDADLNIQQAMRPYALRLAKEKLYPKNVAKKIAENLKDIRDLVDDIPEDTLKLIDKINNDQLAMNLKIDEFGRIENLIKNSINKIVLAVLTLTFGIGGSMLATATVKPMILDMPLLAWLGYILSIFTGSCILLLIFRKK